MDSVSASGRRLLLRKQGGSITGIYTVLADGDNQDDPVVDTARSILDGHVVLSRELAQRGQYPALDIAASLSRVMNDIVSPDLQRLAREFRALSASYEANRDLVLMGAYRAGADMLFLWGRTKAGNRNRAFWGGSSYSPLPLAGLRRKGFGRHV